MPSKHVDLGRELLSAVTSWAKAHTVPCLNGDGPEDVPTVHLILHENASVADQLCQALDQLAPYLIVVAPVELSTEALDETIAQLTEQEADTERIAAARGCRKCVGDVSSIRVTILIKGGPVNLDYTYIAPWVEDAYPDVEEDEDDEESSSAINPEWAAQMERERALRAKWTSAARTDAARRVANDPRFLKAKTEADRVYLTKSVLGEDAPTDDYMLKEISREAKSLFGFEVSPKK